MSFLPWSLSRREREAQEREGRERAARGAEADRRFRERRRQRFARLDRMTFEELQRERLIHELMAQPDCRAECGGEA